MPKQQLITSMATTTERGTGSTDMKDMERKDMAQKVMARKMMLHNLKRTTGVNKSNR